MGYTFDKKTAFSVEGFRVRRKNPDGSYPTPSNHLGGFGPFDCEGGTATDKLQLRLNGTGDFTDIVCDLTAVGVDPGAATVDEVVAALNLITAFSNADLLASKDSSGRIKIAYDGVGTPTYMELKGTIAKLLGFGSYTGNSVGFGTHFIGCFDDAGAIGLPKEIKDFEEIEVEAGDGTLITMVMAAMLKGINPTIAITDEIFELKELIQGGTNDQTVTGTVNRYSPPNTSQVYLPVFAVEVYEAKYEKGSNLRNSIVNYKRLNLNHCNGMEADLSIDVKSWATYQYNLRVREYFEGGVKLPAYTEDTLSIAQFEALLVEAT